MNSAPVAGRGGGQPLDRTRPLDVWLLPLWLLPALLPWGRSAELGTLACLLGFCWLWYRRRGTTVVPGGAIWCWLIGAYLLAALISLPASLHPGRSAVAALGLLRYIPIGLYACRVLGDDRRLHALYRGVAWLVLCWCLDAWLQLLTGWSLGGPAEADRLTGIFGAGNLKLGPVLAVLAPFLLWEGQRWLGWRGCVAAGVLVAVPVVMSGARSAWIMLAWAGGCFAWRMAGSWRRLAGVWLLAGGVMVASSMLAWQFSPRFHARAERSMQLLDGSRQGWDIALSGRLDIWTTAWRMIQAHPWVGVGLRQFRQAYPAYALPGDRFLDIERCGPGQGACHPHQWLLEVLAETGVLGLSCWLAALVLAWRVWRRLSPPRRAVAFPATVAVSAVWFPLNTHLAFYSAWWGLLSIWLLGLWCASLRSRSQEVADAGA